MKYLQVTMPDQSVWEIPVDVIAKNRAESYKEEFDGDIDKSLKEDTLPLFESDEYEIEDWAANNMNWSDVVDSAEKVQNGNIDYQEGWCNGDKNIVERVRRKKIKECPVKHRTTAAAQN